MTPLRGVNLGGWLVIEPWITPSLFDGVTARDEHGWCTELERTVGQEKLRQHRDTFITEADFAWLHEHGLNAVRIPVGHWALEDAAPFTGTQQWLDQALDWATQHSIQVIIDFHAAPGSQNGAGHSGIKGRCEWHAKPEHIERSLGVVEHLAQRYGAHPQLWGIEVLNEPSHKIPRRTLERYYEAAYQAIRRHSLTRVIVSDSFRPYEWLDVMNDTGHTDIVLDAHMYQGFGGEDRKFALEGHVAKAMTAWREEVQYVTHYRQMIVGEWSLALSGGSLESQDELGRDLTMRVYGAAQLMTFERTAGWFYWNYKMERGGSWNFRSCVEQGWLPAKY